MTKLRETILCRRQDSVLGCLLVKAIRARRRYWKARRELARFIGCDPDSDQWLFNQGIIGAPNTHEGEINLARDFLESFGDEECSDDGDDSGVKPIM